MKRKTNNNGLKDNDKTISLILILILGFFLIAPYHQGLFNGGRINFERPIYYAILFASIILIISCIYLFIKKIQVSRMALITIGLVCMLPLAYTISYMNAITPHYALDSIMISWVWVAFFMASLLINRTTVSRDLMIQGIMLTSYILVIGGFLNWFGQVEWEDAILQGRLSGVFQYPNTYAIFLMGIFFSQIYLVTHSERTSRIILFVHKLMIVPVLVSFLLTLSRGAIIILPIMVIIYLVFSTVEKQIKFILYCGITIILSLLVIQPLTRIRTELVTEFRVGLSLQGWLILVFTTLLAVVVIWLVEWCWRRTKVFKSLVQFIRYQSIIPLFLILLTIITAILIITDSRLLSILPNMLENRIRSIDLNDTSSVQRLTYYQDAWSIFKDYPVFGTGGGGWSKLYAEYQQYPYIGNQAHSFYLQTLNEVGLLGILSFLMLLIVIYIRYARHYYKERILDNRHVYLLFATPILIHSFMDFHMSFVLIAVLVFFCLGGMTTNIWQVNSNIHHKNKNLAKNWVSILLIVVSIMFLIISLRFIDAHQKYERALKQQSYEHLAKALDIRPNHPELVSIAVQSLITQYDNTMDMKVLTQASAMAEEQREIEPSNTTMIELHAEILVRQNRENEAVKAYEDLIDLMPWSTRGYEKMIDLQYRMGVIDHVWWDKAINVYQEFNRSIEKIKVKDFYSASMLKMQKIETGISQIYYSRGQYKEALELLAKYTVNNNFLYTQENRITIRYYVASTIKSNIADKGIYDQFIAKFPSEKEEINNILISEPNR